MDCCGSTKPRNTVKNGKLDPKEVENDIKTRQPSNENNPPAKEQTTGGGCCGGGGWGMWLHLIIMIITVLVISYFTRR